MKEQRTCVICPQTFRVKPSDNRKACSMICSQLYNVVSRKECVAKPEAIKYQKGYQKKYRKKPEVIKYFKDYFKDYFKKPEVIKNRKEYNKEYQKRPEVKKRRKKMKIKRSIKQTITRWENFTAKRPEVKEKAELLFR